MNNHLYQVISHKKEILEEQVYLWDLSDDYDLDQAWYDRKNCVDMFVFDDGKHIDYSVGGLIFDINIISARVNKYDNISNDSSSPLISPRLQEFLLKHASDQIQFFDAIIRCKDKQLTNYKLVNITKTACCIDHENSICLRWDSCRIRDFKELRHLPGSMGNLLIAREEEYKSNILLSGRFVKIFVENFTNPVGFNFYLPENMEW
jgi:hypothetical protein